MRRTLPTAALISLLAIPWPALGNGRFPEAQHLVGGPGAEARRLAVRTTFGVLTSDDSGGTWRFYCEDLLGVANTSTWDAPIEFATDGALFAGLPDGLSRIRDGCTAPRVAEVGTDFSADLTTTRDGATLYWLGSSGPMGNRVLASTDGGRTFTPRGTAPDGVLMETIEASDADPARVYVTAVRLEPRDFLLYRSEDGARTFRATPLGLSNIVGAYLAGVDPRSADTLYVRAVRREPDGRVGGTTLLRSRDGGARFEEVARTTGPMMGFAIREGVVWFGGPDDGLWRARDGAAPERIADTPVTCLRWHDGALYACGNHLRTGWAVARSRDDGARFEAILRFDEVSVPRCPGGTVGGDTCGGRWSVLRRTLVPDAGAANPPRDGAVADVPRDGATTPVAPPAGCGCAVPTHLRGPDAVGWSLALLSVRRRRRRRDMLRAPCVAPSSR